MVNTIDVPRIPARGLYSERARLDRLTWIRELCGEALSPYAQTNLEAERLRNNVENMVGHVEIPVGLAGPLAFHGERVQGWICAPFATTEGALVASATRGARALSAADGVATRVTRRQMMRVPMFEFPDMAHAARFVAWLADQFHALEACTSSVSRHARLMEVEPSLMGNRVHVYLRYETGEAAGQNMTTACAWHSCKWIVAQLAHQPDITLRRYYVDANMSGDKKVTAQTFLTGRGRRVVAEATIDAATLERVLKISPEHMVEFYAASVEAASQIGMVGHNINVSNAVAAIFTATGQDIACAHESSLGHLHLKLSGSQLYASMVMPGLIVGTVGGGTHLPNQQAGLSVLGCHGPGSADRLAEIIAGFSLALDLSTLAALASGQFATAHERLGRNRPVDWLRYEQLDSTFFTPMLRTSLADPALSVTRVSPLETTLGSSILTKLTGNRVKRSVGLYPLRLEHRGAEGDAAQTNVVVKVKPVDEEVILMLDTMASQCGERLGKAYHALRHRTGFVGCHLRELEIYRSEDPRFIHHVPKVFGIHEDPERESYVLVLEHLEGLRHLDSVDDVSDWEAQDVHAVLRGAAQLHAIYLGANENLQAQPWLEPPRTAAGMAEMSELWRALAVHAAEEFPELVSSADLRRSLTWIQEIGTWWRPLEQLPRTLIHNDFNPRNLALRPDSDGPRLCAYDWELATVHVPQHDLAELLCFVLPPNIAASAVVEFVEAHRLALSEASGQPLHRGDWWEGFRLCLRDLVLNRIGLYLMGHTFHRYRFLPRVLATLKRLSELTERGSLGL